MPSTLSALYDQLSSLADRRSEFQRHLDNYHVLLNSVRLVHCNTTLISESLTHFEAEITSWIAELRTTLTALAHEPEPPHIDPVDNP